MVLHNIPRQVPHSSDRNPQPAPRIEAVHFAKVWSLPDTPLRYCCSCSPVPQWIPHPEAARSILQPKAVPPTPPQSVLDRKSTRLNSSHVSISYAVFCLKKNIKHTR